MIKLKAFLKRNIIGTQFEWESHFANVLHLCNKNLKSFRPHNLLDVGCGIGQRTLRLARYFDIESSNTHGVEYDEQKVRVCNALFKAAQVDLETSGLPYDDDAFDLVMCNQVLEHLKNYKNVIFEMIRVTRKKGFIVLGIPNLAHLINRLYLLLGYQPMCIGIDSTHLRGFTHSGFVQMLGNLSHVQLLDYTGALMYPLPRHAADCLSKRFVGFSGYTCYLLQKQV